MLQKMARRPRYRFIILPSCVRSFFFNNASLLARVALEKTASNVCRVLSAWHCWRSDVRRVSITKRWIFMAVSFVVCPRVLAIMPHVHRQYLRGSTKNLTRFSNAPLQLMRFTRALWRVTCAQFAMGKRRIVTIIWLFEKCGRIYMWKKFAPFHKKSDDF